MKGFFYPKSVAVVGVSANQGNLGQWIIQNLNRFGYQGIIHEVGRSGGVYAGRRIYRSVSDIPDAVDLAVILTPARTVPEILDQCGEKGIKRIVLETAGFRESGEDGRLLEEQVVERLRRYEMRLIGPNGLGVVNTEVGLATPFMPIEERVRPGGVSLISQSGGVALGLFSVLAEENLGLNKLVSSGNMLDVPVEELLEYLIEDPGTRMIVLYLEGIRDGRKLMEAARRSRKPILAIKGNTGSLGKAIATSHSASLSNDDAVVDAAFRQCGILRIDNPTYLGAYLKGFTLPQMRGPNLAILSRSGGHAVMAADACEDYGFALAPFPATFLEEIEKRFRASVIKLTNPLDLGDLFDLEFYKRIIDQTLGLPEVHGVLFMLTYVAGHEAEKAREVLRYAGESAKRTGKPVVLYVASAQHEIQHLRQELEHPVFTHVEEAVRSLHVVRDYLELSERARAWAPPAAVRPAGDRARELVELAARERRDLYLHEATEALACYGMPMTRIRHVHGVDEAVAAANDLGWPVALKLVSRQISHKSDVGGVQLNLRSEAGLRQAHEEMIARVRKAFPDADVEGLLVQPMVVGGREMIVGGRRDAAFGPVVLVGLGGIFVEVLREAALRPAPVTADEARRMIGELRGAAILRGARGTLPSDLDALADCIVRVSQLLVDLPLVREVDANPVRVFGRGEGCVALDARVLVDPR